MSFSTFKVQSLRDFFRAVFNPLLTRLGALSPPVFKGSGDNHESIASFFLPSLCAFYFIVCCLSIKIFPIRFSYYVDDFALRIVISENINLKIIRRVHGYDSENHAGFIINWYFLNG